MESVGEILARSRSLKKRVKPPALLTRSQEKLIDAATDIRMNPDDAEAAFMARELVQCTLPHKNPGNQLRSWKRTNGYLTLGIAQGVNHETGETYGFPYGIIPRLLLFWMTTEAVRTKERRLELGHSLAEFMREVGLDPSRGGKRSDARRLQNQMRRLFRATISFQYTIEQQHRRGEGWRDMQVAPEGELWWDAHDPEQGTLWGSYVVLGELFYKAITGAPVPVDLRVLRAIKRSPLALDLYAWVTWRGFKLRRSASVPWLGLMEQMGSEYASEKEFARKAKAALRKIRACYPALKLDFVKGGLVVHPSPPAIAPAAKRVTAPPPLAQLRNDTNS